LASTFKFRDVILGRQVIPSRSEYKRLMLTGYMAAVCILVSIFYASLDIANNVFYAFPAYALLFFMPLLSVVLIRYRYFQAGKIVLVVSANLAVFWSAAVDPFETGAFLFFIPAGIGSFAIMSFEHHRTSFALAGFTTLLFLTAYFSDYKFVDIVRPTDMYIRISFVANYFISLTVSVLAVYFLIRLNSASERELIMKENTAIQKNEELQKVNDELDRFVYSVSHDLRSPLSSILGLTNIARASNDPKEIHDILNMINGRIMAQDHFIKEIIDYARNARTEVVPEPVNVSQLVNEISDSLKFNHNADKISFQINIDPEFVLTVDRIRLSIVLNNLISNSIKYHDFRKENPFISIKYDKVLHALQVQDNGSGIKAEHQEKIFRMFYRGSDKSTGSGLGLFITKEAVAKLNGRIEVQSTFGEGSTFTVYLPHLN
jgi:signal transduction histidine kinase